jgi:hypothetical protein
MPRKFPIVEFTNNNEGRQFIQKLYSLGMHLSDRRSGDFDSDYNYLIEGYRLYHHANDKKYIWLYNADSNFADCYYLYTSSSPVVGGLIKDYKLTIVNSYEHFLKDVHKYNLYPRQMEIVL